MENTVNTELIMAQIKKEIREKALSADSLSFNDTPEVMSVPDSPADNVQADKADAAFRYIGKHCRIRTERTLSGSPVKVFFKKLVRRAVMFCIEPLASDQSDFNEAAAAAMDHLRISSGTDVNAELVERLGAVERLHTGLIKRLEHLEEENASLRAELELLKEKKEQEDVS